MKNSMLGKMIILFCLLSDFSIATRYRIFPIPFFSQLYFGLAMFSLFGVGVWAVSRHYEPIVKKKDLYLKHFQEVYPTEYAALVGLSPIVHSRQKQQSTVEKEVL